MNISNTDNDHNKITVPYLSPLFNVKCITTIFLVINGKKPPINAMHLFLNNVSDDNINNYDNNNRNNNNNNNNNNKCFRTTGSDVKI